MLSVKVNLAYLKYFSPMIRRLRELERRKKKKRMVTVDKTARFDCRRWIWSWPKSMVVLDPHHSFAMWFPSFLFTDGGVLACCLGSNHNAVCWGQLFVHNYLPTRWITIVVWIQFSASSGLHLTWSTLFLPWSCISWPWTWEFSIDWTGTVGNCKMYMASIYCVFWRFLGKGLLPQE